MTRWLGTFTQWLLVAFLLIAALPAGIALHAVATFERLMSESDRFAARSLQLSAAVQLLSERSTVMERTARQSLALDDALLRRRFEQVARDSRETLAQLEPSHDVPATLLENWKQQLDSIIASFGSKPGESAAQRDVRVAAAFAELTTINTLIAQEARHTIDERREALQRQLDASRAQLTRLVWIAIAVALFLAVAFGLWLSRPFRRIERAILRLGGQRDEEPISINGPVDIRLIGRQLEWLRLRLAQLDADKARFLRHVSHELKTPLAALSEGVALLEDESVGKLNDDQREVAKILRHNTQSLRAQIDALLRFNAAAFEASRLKREPTDLRALLEQQVEAQRLQWQARGLELRVEGEPLVEPVDPDKLGTAIANLLSNAIRFSPPAGRVVCRLHREHERTCIDVCDSGPGVAEADRTRIFEPFYRGQRQSEGVVRGTGIGLSIVQEYVAAHGGRVLLLPDETDSSGTCFRIELPHAS